MDKVRRLRKWVLNGGFGWFGAFRTSGCLRFVCKGRLIGRCCLRSRCCFCIIQTKRWINGFWWLGTLRNRHHFESIPELYHRIHNWPNYCNRSTWHTWHHWYVLPKCFHTRIHKWWDWTPKSKYFCPDYKMRFSCLSRANQGILPEFTKMILSFHVLKALSGTHTRIRWGYRLRSGSQMSILRSCRPCERTLCIWLFLGARWL